ncbi:MAG: DUF2254 domain-containing protein [Pseudolabrys sp.]
MSRTRNAGPASYGGAGIIPRLLTLWYAVSTSLWALPLLIVAGAIVAAYLALNVRLGGSGMLASFLDRGSADAAAQFMSGLLTAMITMATLAISITMVVLTLAAQQLGPRIIRSFIADKKTQAALGLFLGTVAYLLVVLYSVSGAGRTAPNLAISGGSLLVLISVAMLVVFVHHLANAIVADNAIARIGVQLDTDVSRLLPDADDMVGPAPPKLDRTKAAAVRLEISGYVQAIDYEAIVNAACAADAIVEIGMRPGHFAVDGGVIAWIAGGKDRDSLAHTIQNAVVVGAERTPVQDIEFSIRQMVEIAVRALSPGINDPFTAIAVLDRLSSSLAAVMRRAPARSVLVDDQRKPRVIVSRSTFEGLVAAAFDQIRQNGAQKPAILIQMADNLCQLIALADDERKSVLLDYLDLVEDAGKAIAQKHDRDALIARVENARRGDCLPREETAAKPQRKPRRS